MAQDALDRVAAASAGPCATHRIRLAGWDRPSGDLAAQLRFAATHELALTVDDLLDRRTRLGFVPQWRADALEAAREALAG
jgi:glycerol-3-phosphate dehydrogenase